jgi:hypothetical protein
MNIDEKIKIGLVALTAISAIAVAAHFGHVSTKPPLLDIIGGPGSH